MYLIRNLEWTEGPNVPKSVDPMHPGVITSHNPLNPTWVTIAASDFDAALNWLLVVYGIVTVEEAEDIIDKAEQL